MMDVEWDEMRQDINAVISLNEQFYKKQLEMQGYREYGHYIKSRLKLELSRMI